jgi:anaerobic selenocysteine-containing dehydrogenase
VPDSSGDEPDGRDEGLCPHDIGSVGPLLDDDIRAMFAKRGAGVRIILISDSCHSGTVTRGREDDLDPGMPRARFLPLEAWMPKGELPRAAARPATLVSGLRRAGSDLLLAGCMDTEYSWDTSFQGRPNGAFTYYALKSLRDAKPATYGAWFNAIRAYLPSTGTNNLDTNSRLCMSSAVAGYKLSLGADAPPCSYEDIAHTGALFISGSNTAFAHPIAFRRVEDARKANPEMKLVVIDPRRTDTAEAADLHLALLPGTDIALYNAMLHVMLWEGWVDRGYIDAHTEGFDALKKAVREYTPSMAAAICGLERKAIEAAAQIFATSPATMSMYCQGLNQYSFGTHNNSALINLHLATGQIGRPGAGPFSLTGQPNAMGGREVGGLANLLSAHRDMANPQHRAEVAALWGVDEVPEKPGRSAVELFEGLQSGEVKAVWIACTNPAQSMPDQAMIHAALQKAEFVVVQEAFGHTETCAYADLLLPASTWGEKDGTVTNSERAISRVRAAVSAPGEARHDWAIVVDFARRLGIRLGKGELAARMFPYTTPEQIWNEHRESTRGRDLDITGLSYALLESAGPQQWPFPEGASQGKVRLYEDGVFPTPSGRARFVVTEHRITAESPSARYPLHLNTGRLRDQWHGMSRTGLVARLYSHEAEPLLHMHKDDMERRGLTGGDLVQVKSKRGAVVLKVMESATLRPGQTFLPMHWGGNTMGGQGVNVLLPRSFDPRFQAARTQARSRAGRQIHRRQGAGGHAPLGAGCRRPPATQPPGCDGQAAPLAAALSVRQPDPIGTQFTGGGAEGVRRGVPPGNA